MTLRMVRIRLSVCCARTASLQPQQVHHAIELVQKLLEPQLVDLVDHDEEHLVVFRPVRPAVLKIEQLVDAQVAAVRDGSRA